MFKAWLLRKACEVVALAEGEDCLWAARHGVGGEVGQERLKSHMQCRFSKTQRVGSPGREAQASHPPPQRADPTYFSHFLENALCKPYVCQPSSVSETHLFVAAKGNGNL